MKKILSVFALFSACSGAAWAAPVACYGGYTCDAATRYDVNVQEVALCQDAACTSNYVVGSGAKSFNIASAAVGAAIGSYAKVDAIPVGVYTHVRAVIDRTFTLSGPSIAGCNVTPPSNIRPSVPNQADIGTNILAGQAPALAWDDALQTKIRIIQQLTTPIAISKGGARPAVTIKFDTQQGLMCAAGQYFPAPPTVTISVSQ